MNRRGPSPRPSAGTTALEPAEASTTPTHDQLDWDAPGQLSQTVNLASGSPMNVGIYCEPHGGAPGGAEFCVAALAEALRPFHNVEIVQHRPDLTIDELSRMFGTDLDGCTVRPVPLEWRMYYGPTQPGGRAREAREWRWELSAPYDLFVNFTPGLPPFCQAPIGVLVVLFPWFDRRKEGPCRRQG